jgi:hypothetical protein
MSATINWRVGTMECYPTYEQNIDVVFTVHWDCLGSETVSGSTYNGRVYGATGVTYHSGSTFTPYNQLSQDVVLGWVWDSIGTDQKSNYENSVQTQINNQINPPVVILPLPWTPPSIVQQPQNVSVLSGSSITFTVVASGPSDLSYQWSKDSSNITNAVSSSYTIESVQDSDVGSYTVLVSGNNGQTVNSNPATLTIMSPPTPPTPTPPIITEQPSSQTVVVGDGAAFNVNATGESPFAYQWFKDDTEIVGATGNTHIIQTSTLTDAGDYKATVTNISGTTTSDTATLTVNE